MFTRLRSDRLENHRAWAWACWLGCNATKNPIRRRWFYTFKDPNISREIYGGLIRGSRSHLAQAITLVESTNPHHRERANELLEAISKSTQKENLLEDEKKITYRVGISGPGGAGKSSIIEKLGLALVSKVKIISVLFDATIWMSPIKAYCH